MTHDSTNDTREHITKVQVRLNEIIGILRARLNAHDWSKFGAAEKPGYDIISAVLAGHAFGTDAYNVAMAEARQHPAVVAAIAHHYAANDHHPEHTPDGIAGMSLLSVAEMIADWKGASERSGNTFSIEFQIERFGIEPQLAAILRNTVTEMGW